MKKYMILVPLLVFAAFANPMRAQEADNPLQREIDSLGIVLGKLDSRIEEQENKLGHFNKAKENCDKVDRSINTYRTKIKERGKVIDSIECLLATKQGMCDSLKQVNDDLYKYKKQVVPLVERQLCQMAITVENEWTGKTYAATDMAKLTNEMALYADFKDKDKGVAEAYKKLKAFGGDAILFAQGMAIVSSPYNADTIAAIMQPFRNLVKKETHPARKLEVELLLSQLEGYKGCLESFQALIQKIERKRENYRVEGTHTMAWVQLKMFLESTDKGKGGMDVKQLSQIPWLKEQYMQYVKQLEKDPYAPNPARNAIMELQP